VRLAKDQHPIQALATHSADQALRIPVLPGRSALDRAVTLSPAVAQDLSLCLSKNVSTSQEKQLRNAVEAADAAMAVEAVEVAEAAAPAAPAAVAVSTGYP
jgi:hypothetical protein